MQYLFMTFSKIEATITVIGCKKTIYIISYLYLQQLSVTVGYLITIFSFTDISIFVMQQMSDSYIDHSNKCIEHNILRGLIAYHVHRIATHFNIDMIY